MDTPVTFIVGDIMSEDEFFRFCQMNDTLNLERDSEGNIIFMSPSGGLSDNLSSKILIALGLWLDQHDNPGTIFGSSAGFTLPNGAVRSPDVSWVNSESWDALSESDQERFAHVCPDFVVEVRSKTDSIIYLQNKMQEYMANGSRLGWLIDKYAGKVFVYEPGKTIVEHPSLNIRLSGEPVFPGFELDLAKTVRK
ncbi:Endonuclease, Uma2 family (restriction endonuclease fold) [Dyadobacter sp. SG02]|uniref:Uma2 family endonuclease n=1 Tax=Dyadobacter sp. SG02 TaxID=1855291 RepID=UPI0008D47C31|nr:Uma2 family endonuclease [Dyadobacter sp. SG02]SEI64906.1 Endonuclease, Uma2 family (restriction endonuclease fold) [Dyadobacter sp. SG02]